MKNPERYLSDGTRVEKGIIVTIIKDSGGNKIGVTTKVEKYNKDDVECTNMCTDYPRILIWNECFFHLRKATPREQREYYKNLKLIEKARRMLI